MGYERIMSWVEDHYNPRDFNNYMAFEMAVRRRFEDDGISFPKGAVGEMQDYFARFFEQPESPILKPDITLEQYMMPEPEILQISDDFLSVQPAPEFFTTPAALPERFAPPKMSFFGKLRTGLRRLFRLFRL